MGNSENAARCHGPSEATNADAGNGILVRIRGDYVSDAMRLLRKPTSEGQQQEVVTEVEGFGQVRFYARVKEVRHHKHSHLYWAAYWAEAIRQP